MNTTGAGAEDRYQAAESQKEFASHSSGKIIGIGVYYRILRRQWRTPGDMRRR